MTDLRVWCGQRGRECREIADLRVWCGAREAGPSDCRFIKGVVQGLGGRGPRDRLKA